MSNPQQPRGISEEDRERAIREYTGTGDFLKKILEGETGKKVDNFLTQQDMLAGRFNNPAGLPLDLYEAIMRQYGKEEQFGPYTDRDAKMISNAYKSGIL
tara:strand:- start:54 stop:353 length:300 start_codon:yes stop_codon:yes gene_type:complete